MSETRIVREIQLAVAPFGIRLFRNNVGMLEDRRGNKVRYGLAVGSSDLIGWTPAQAAGQSIAVFTAIEVKTETGKPTYEQTQFILAVRASGGIAGVARNGAQAVDLISRGLREKNFELSRISGSASRK